MILKESLLELCFLGFVVSCGGIVSHSRKSVEPRVLEVIRNDPREQNVIEAPFVPLVEEFESIARVPVTTPIFFADDLSPEILGVCVVWTKSDITVKEIKINRKTFGRDAIESEMIVFHELGHCERGRPHDQTQAVLNDGRVVPFSLMFPSLFLSSDYSQYHTHYLLELFKRGSLLTKLDGAPLESPETAEKVSRNGFDGYVYP